MKSDSRIDLTRGTTSNTVSTASISDNSIELNVRSTSDNENNRSQEDGRAVGRWKKPLAFRRKLINCLCQRKTLSYCLMIAAVWIVSALPTLVFITLDSQVCISPINCLKLSSED